MVTCFIVSFVSIHITRNTSSGLVMEYVPSCRVINRLVDTKDFSKINKAVKHFVLVKDRLDTDHDISDYSCLYRVWSIHNRNMFAGDFNSKTFSVSRNIHTMYVVGFVYLDPNYTLQSCTVYIDIKYFSF